MSNKMIDLRSDTVTKPSPEMWEALRSLDDSKIGDDVFKEDPTVNKLEEKAAKLTGKEAALLVTSGTQGNITSLLSSTKPGDEILVEANSHILLWEVGGAARIGGLISRTYLSEKGMASLNDLKSLIRPRNDDHQPWTTLICVENTHNKHGGTIITPEYLDELRQFAMENNMKIHMDGARIFNAAVALGLPVTSFSKYVDSMMFCLSKGLSCPIGSIVVGSKEFVEKARKYRKMLGGGMRQAGVVGIMGLIALEEKWIKRLKEDHENAKRLSQGFQDNNLPIKVQSPETNIVMVECPISAPMDELIRGFNEEGILTLNMQNKIRFVTHYGITVDDIDYCIEKIIRVLTKILGNL